MAAAQWKGGKSKSAQAAKAFFRHNDPEERLKHEHTNPHIGASSAEHNFNYRGLDYAGMCRAYDKRLGEVDQGKPGSGKNTRVVMQSVILYPPAGLTDEADMVRWFRRAGDMLAEKYGDDFIEMSAHFDEQHEYRNEAGELVKSRPHAHACMLPVVDGKLNGKQFSARARINELNRELQEMSLREFGCPMMDGSKAKGGRTVEHMKAESRGREIIAKAEERAELEADMIRGKAQVDAVQISGEAADWSKRHKQAAEARARATEATARAEAVQEAQRIREAASADLQAAGALLERVKQFSLSAEEKEQLRALEAEKMRQQEAIAAAQQQAGNVKGRSSSAPGFERG